MFTNWLTGTTGLTNPNTSTSLSRSQDNHTSVAAPPPPGLSSLLNTNSLTNLNSNIMSSPPDIILEVGPAPTTIRFMAHGIVLGMHSGYLRSAIRLDERSSGGSGGVASNPNDTIVYLTNVTPEQFAPLLTYMYTGYLDLNVENIFGVLLATHVLHMPRALEICRSYLARAQTEGYFGTNNNALTNSTSHQSLPPNCGKIIRPIASKPQLPNFGFLPIVHPIGLTTAAATTIPNATTINTRTSPQDITKCPSNHSEECSKSEEDIEVAELDKHSVCNDQHLQTLVDNDDDEDDEDVEVFIDSTSDAEVIVEMEIQNLSFKKSVETKKIDKETKSKHEKSHHHRKSHKSERRRKSSSGLQVAKAPIPASQLDTSEANKVIIDVASCDGPVRFKRILNTAYGHKPESCNVSGNHGGMSGAGQERSLQSVSLSFHQQMAKTISQQQQLHHAEESENSETSNCSNGGGGGGGGGASGGVANTSSKANRKIQSEIFVCVYCKHTFKSQYCYQKHAKRHLNPLTLQATCVPESKREPKEELSSTSHQATELQITKHQNLSTTRPFYIRNSTHLHATNGVTSHHPQAHGQSGVASSSSSLQSSSSDYLRREVRPLDMNVQYYPCKTCGSKFPSYYFVHKHRKMCHAEEEAAAAAAVAQQNSDNRSDSTTTSQTTVVQPLDNQDE